MRGERSLETKARFRRLWESDQLADLGPERPRPRRQYLDPPWPRWRVSASCQDNSDLREAKPGRDQPVAPALSTLGPDCVPACAPPNHSPLGLSGRRFYFKRHRCRLLQLSKSRQTAATAVRGLFLCILLPVTRETIYWSKAV